MSIKRRSALFTATAAVVLMIAGVLEANLASATGSGLTITTSTTVSSDPTCGAGACVEVNGSGLQVNGASHVVDCHNAPGSIGVLVLGSTNHVSSFEVRNCEIGVKIDHGSGHHLNDLYIHDSIYTGTQKPGSGDGLFLYFTTGNLINGNRIIGNDAFGVHVENSTRNTFHTMWVTDNCPPTAAPPPHSGGYLFSQSNDNRVTSNDISRNGDVGVEFRSSDRNTVQSSIVDDTGCGRPPGSGIVLWSSSDYNTLRGNEAMRNENGISIGCPLGCSYTALAGTASNNNTIWDNTTSNNLVEGIQIAVRNFRNRLQSNTSQGNGQIDMRDDNPNCDQDVWKSDIFTTDSEGNGPTAGCIR